MTQIISVQCSRAVLAAALMLCAGRSARADTIVPNDLATVEGDSNNVIPFFWTQSLRYQQVYASGDFLNAASITGLLFRPDLTFGHPFSATVTSVRIDLSTTAFGPDQLQPVFALNVGADNTPVFNGSLHVSSAATGPGPRDFDIQVPFTTPFFFNPALGNLLLDVRVFLTSPFAGSTFDAASRVGDSVSRLWEQDVNAVTGRIDSFGLVTAFQTQAPVAPTPEPASAILLGTAVAGVIASRRRRSQQFRG
jgi:hypothetical protein